jgi:cysteine desulfurase
MTLNKQHIYLDYGATTPVDSRVLEVMQPYFREDFGNPVSVHHFGQRAEAALEKARFSLAEGIGAKNNEIIFTSGATESDNLALRGAAFQARKSRGANHILISAVEHDAISRSAQQLAELFDFEVELVYPDEFGQISAQSVSEKLRDDTAIVSVLMANNEVGTISPIKEIALECKKRKVLFHTDAVQAAAYLPLDVKDLGVDLLSLGAHKFYGPKGIGALFVKEGSQLSPTQTGGGHEFSLRGGTQNTAYIVGMAEAFDILQSELEQRTKILLKKRDRVIEGVLKNVPNSKLSGHPSERLPNHASFFFRNIDGNELLMHLDNAGFACSSGSACKTGDPEPSDVILAMGFDRAWALGSLRVTLGIHTSEKEIDQFLDVLPTIVEKLRP